MDGADENVGVRIHCLRTLALAAAQRAVDVDLRAAAAVPHRDVREHVCRYADVGAQPPRSHLRCQRSCVDSYPAIVRGNERCSYGYK